jgi:hypothetical protein
MTEFHGYQDSELSGQSQGVGWKNVYTPIMLPYSSKQYYIKVADFFSHQKLY